MKFHINQRNLKINLIKAKKNNQTIYKVKDKKVYYQYKKLVMNIYKTNRFLKL